MCWYDLARTRGQTASPVVFPGVSPSLSTSLTNSDDQTSDWLTDFRSRVAGNPSSPPPFRDNWPSCHLVINGVTTKIKPSFVKFTKLYFSCILFHLYFSIEQQAQDKWARCEKWKLILRLRSALAQLWSVLDQMTWFVVKTIKKFSDNFLRCRLTICHGKRVLFC